MPPLIKVRTCTVGVCFERGNPKQWVSALENAAAFNAAASEAFTEAGFEVQTTRVATQPFEEWIEDVMDVGGALATFRELDAELRRLKIELFNMGPATSPSAIALVPKVIALGPRISASASLADPLDASAASSLAGAILEIAKSTAGGEGNFQFCCSFNVSPGIPFFPAAFHASGKPMSFGIGCETSAILADALPRASGDLRKGRALLTAAFREQLEPIEAISRRLSTSHKLTYTGIDASIAPLGTAPPLTDAFESLGLGAFGESGTLAVSSLVTSAVKALREPAGQLTICGYTGLMLPPCEDAGLARRAIEQGYRIHDLLMYSAVCGLGLDTVPIAGDTPQPKLCALLLDVAALAFRLDKPLTARLFPVPGKAAGELTGFAHPILCDTRVFEVP
jgi:uncharacterized protein (UPF0210 family)